MSPLNSPRVHGLNNLNNASDVFGEDQANPLPTVENTGYALLVDLENRVDALRIEPEDNPAVRVGKKILAGVINTFAVALFSWAFAVFKTFISVINLGEGFYKIYEGDHAAAKACFARATGNLIYAAVNAGVSFIPLAFSITYALSPRLVRLGDQYLSDFAEQTVPTYTDMAYDWLEGNVGQPVSRFFSCQTDAPGAPASGVAGSGAPRARTNIFELRASRGIETGANGAPLMNINSPDNSDEE